MKPSRYLLLALMASILFSNGCSSTPKADLTPEQQYSMGEEAFRKSRYEQAVDNWKKVREAFPAPELAAKAEIGIANAYFLDSQYIEAGAAYEEFRKLHPVHELAQFALYRQAIASFNLISGIDTDQTPVKNALTLFESFARQYPASQYAAKVNEKIVECRGKLAQYEIYVGRFYYRTDRMSAAISRLEGALANFPDYSGNDETLFYLGKAYSDTKQYDKLQSVLSRLVREYPSSKHLGDARKMLAEKS